MGFHLLKLLPHLQFTFKLLRKVQSTTIVLANDVNKINITITTDTIADTNSPPLYQSSPISLPSVAVTPICELRMVDQLLDVQLNPLYPIAPGVHRLGSRGFAYHNGITHRSMITHRPIHTLSQPKPIGLARLFIRVAMYGDI